MTDDCEALLLVKTDAVGAVELLSDVSLESHKRIVINLDTDPVYLELVIVRVSSLEELPVMVELFAHGGNKEADSVGQRLDVEPEPVHDEVMVVEVVPGPATVLEFDQKTELNDEKPEPPVPVTVMMGGVPVLDEVEDVITVGEELVISVSVVDEESLLKVGMTVADEIPELP